MEEVLQYKLDSIYENYQDRLQKEKELSMATQVRLYFQIYVENMPFFNALIDNDLTSILMHSALRYMQILRKNKQLPQNDNMIYSDPFIVGGLLQVQIAWHQQDPATRISLDELIELTQKFLQNRNFEF